MTTKIQSSPLTRKTTYKRLIFNYFKELLTRFYGTAMILFVEQILSIKRKASNADTSAIEREIDHKVYELYGLTDEEIRVIEG